MSYLLTGVTATGDDGHTAHFHDYRNILSAGIEDEKTESR